jgi:flagellar protein FlbT
MNLTLRAGERLYINGGVIRVDRKVTIELLNDVTFLLQSHVLQADEATTPLRQIYFAVQVLLMEPNAASYAIGLADQLIAAASLAYRTPEIVEGLKAIADLLTRRRYFEALKALRALYALEKLEMFPPPPDDRSQAA